MTIINTGDTDTLFKYNDLNYRKGGYEVYYIQAEQGGNNWLVGVKNTYNKEDLVEPQTASNYTVNGVVYLDSEIDVLVQDLSVVLGFNEGGGGTGDVPNLQQVTGEGNTTTLPIISSDDIQGNTLSVTSTIDSLMKASFKGDNIFSSYDVQLPDWSGTATMMIEENMSLYVQGTVGQVGVFVGERNIRSFSGLLYDFSNNRLAVGVTTPTTTIDTSTLRARNLPVGDTTYTKLVVAKSDGTFGLIDKPVFQNIPTDFFITGNVSGNTLTYKTDSYRTLNVQSLLVGLPSSIVDINEIIRIGNTFYLTANYGINADQYIIALRDCYIENNVLIVGSAQWAISGIFQIHSLNYNEIDGMIYIASRRYSTPFPNGAVQINKIDPNTLNILASSNFPNNITYQNSTTDIKIFNNKLYLTAGAGANFRVVELSTNLQDYTEIYSGTSDVTLTHIANTAFEIYNGKMYLTCYDATAGVDLNTNIRVVELDLITRSVRTSSKIILTSTVGASIQAHWLTVYNDKILATVLSNGATFYYTALVRIDIKNLTKDDELVLDMPVTDDNSILDGYLYLNGESFTSVQPDYPKDNAKLLRVNPMNFVDRTTEIAVFNAGKGSYGSLNYNVKSVIQLDDIRTDAQQVITSASSYTLVPTRRLIHAKFKGTTTTFNLPPIATSDKMTMLLYNAGIGNVTITADAGDGNNIIDGNITSNTFVLTPNTPMTMFSIDSTWITKP